jgi:predicted ABC-type transport system involved in lysophospholipase L1 biosynthesis ATPase subunit
LDQHKHLPTRLRVQRSGWLVGAQKRRVDHERASDSDPLLLPARQFGRQPVHLRQEPDRVEGRQQGRTIVMVTHDLQIAAQAPRVMHMSDGHMSDGAVVFNEDLVAPALRRELVTQ